MNAAKTLVAKNLYVSLDGMPILRDVSLDVAAGEAVALLGGNGSGKSTLIRTLLRLVPHQEGSVELLGEPLNGFKRWSQVGYVPQHSSVGVSNATVAEIVAAGRLAHRKPFQWLGKADKAAVDAALSQVGMQDRKHWPFSALSGGQKQRVLIARALTTDPVLLLMDEPLAGVDLHSQQGLADLLIGLRDKGLALLIVLHEQGPMAALVNRAITLCDGRVVPNEGHDAHGCSPAPSEPVAAGLSDPLSGVMA